MLSLLLSLFSVFTFSASAAYNQYGDYIFSKSTGTISKYTGSAANVEVPAVIDGVAVIRIGTFAFQGCTSLVSVNIPNGVLYLDWYIFEGCSSLKYVTVPNSVKIVYEGVLTGCTSLTGISFGKDTKVSPSESPIKTNTLVMYGADGSDAKRYATWANIPFVPISLTSNLHNVNSTKEIITKIAPEASVESLSSSLTGTNTIKIMSSDGVEITTGTVTTGMKVRMYKDDFLLCEYKTVIYGDTNGDGLINSLDLLAVKNMLLSKQALYGAYKEAANTDKDSNGAVNALDLLKLKKCLLNLGTISQD